MIVFFFSVACYCNSSGGCNYYRNMTSTSPTMKHVVAVAEDIFQALYLQRKEIVIDGVRRQNQEGEEQGDVI